MVGTAFPIIMITAGESKAFCSVDVGVVWCVAVAFKRWAFVPETLELSSVDEKVEHAAAHAITTTTLIFVARSIGVLIQQHNTQEPRAVALAAQQGDYSKQPSRAAT